MTVLGPVPAGSLGPTLPHEHLLCDVTCYWQSPTEGSLVAFSEAPVTMELLGRIKLNPVLNRDNCRLTDLDLAIEELMEFRRLGGGTFVDVTLAEIGRDPRALQVAARVTGVNIVAGCGHYTYLSHPPELEDEALESIAERFVRELTEGIGTTGVRPGVIGEIGTSDPIHPREDKVLRAAARAHRETGTVVTVHLHSTGRNGPQVLDILEEEGVNLARTVMDHVDSALAQPDIGFDEAIDYYRSLAERGCFIEFDTIGNDSYYAKSRYGPRGHWAPSDRERAEAIARMLELGFADQILLSQDVCTKHLLVHYGGFGYGHILRNFCDHLRDYGVSDEERDRLLVDNPRRMLVPSL
jgi:phosphotriesterase-related protein